MFEQWPTYELWSNISRGKHATQHHNIIICKRGHSPRLKLESTLTGNETSHSFNPYQYKRRVKSNPFEVVFLHYRVEWGSPISTEHFLRIYQVKYLPPRKSLRKLGNAGQDRETREEWNPSSFIKWDSMSRTLWKYKKKMKPEVNALSQTCGVGVHSNQWDQSFIFTIIVGKNSKLLSMLLLSITTYVNQWHMVLYTLINGGFSDIVIEHYPA